jgi:hypothetical protein
MSNPRKFEVSEQDLLALMHALNKFEPLFKLLLSDEDTAGICALPSCGLPFVKRESKQAYCCPAHQVKASNDRRVKRHTLTGTAIADAPMVKCQVAECQNQFVLDMRVPFPYRCRECAAKSV